MLTPEQERGMQEIESLKFFCKKILQAQRIRLMSMKKRRQLLEAIKHKFENIGSFKGTVERGFEEKGIPHVTFEGQDAFYYRLNNTLKGEEKLLEIVKREDRGAESNLKYVMEQLEYFKRKYSRKGYQIPLPDGTRISEGELFRFLRSVIIFLELVQDDLSRVESRMELERLFLDSKHPEHFEHFLRAWEAEQESNMKMVQQFRTIIKRNSKIIQKGEKNIGKLLGTATGGLIAGGFVIAKAKEPLDVLLGLAFAVFGIGMGFFLYERDIIKNQLIETEKDEKLLKQLEEVGAIKKKFW